MCESVKVCEGSKNGNTSKNLRGNKKFYWDVVLNNYTIEDCEVVKDVFENISSSCIIGKEVGKEGTPHLQGMIKLKKGNYKSFILNKFKDSCVGNRMSIREGRNIEALKHYCLKDGDILYSKNTSAIGNREKSRNINEEVCDDYINNAIEKYKEVGIKIEGKEELDKWIEWIKHYRPHCRNDYG